MIYYDAFDTWGDSFGEFVLPLIGQKYLDQLGNADFEYIEDAGEFVSGITGVKRISSEIFNWVSRNEFCVFHGTRLLPSELKSLIAVGLKPLEALSRQERLSEIFSRHEDWGWVKEGLIEVLRDVGPRERDGRREQQIHFSLSKTGLVNGFNHYLTHGSEFDQRVASRLFSDDSGLRLLRSETTPYLVHVKISGQKLIQGAHPFFSYQDIVDMG